METTVAQMTRDELDEAVIERKLLGDPDEGLPLQKAVRERRLRQKEAVSAGERGEPLEDVARQLGLESYPCIPSACWRPLSGIYLGWISLPAGASLSTYAG